MEHFIRLVFGINACHVPHIGNTETFYSGKLLLYVPRKVLHDGFFPAQGHLLFGKLRLKSNVFIPFLSLLLSKAICVSADTFWKTVWANMPHGHYVHYNSKVYFELLKTFRVTTENLAAFREYLPAKSEDWEKMLT